MQKIEYMSVHVDTSLYFSLSLLSFMHANKARDEKDTKYDCSYYSFLHGWRKSFNRIYARILGCKTNFEPSAQIPPPAQNPVKVAEDPHETNKSSPSPDPYCCP